MMWSKTAARLMLTTNSLRKSNVEAVGIKMATRLLSTTNSFRKPYVEAVGIKMATRLLSTTNSFRKPYVEAVGIKMATRLLSTTNSQWTPYVEVMRIIGSREIVGHGCSGHPIYFDNPMFPYPPIRFREITPALKAIREKERGDWKFLTPSEKKCLYRLSFCQTMVEATYPPGEWKSIIGSVLIFINIAVIFFLFIRFLTWHELPETFDDEQQAAKLRRILDLRMNPIEGISSKWDYDEDDWIQPGVKKKKADD